MTTVLEGPAFIIPNIQMERRPVSFFQAFLPVFLTVFTDSNPTIRTEGLSFNPNRRAWDFGESSRISLLTSRLNLVLEAFTSSIGRRNSTRDFSFSTTGKGSVSNAAGVNQWSRSKEAPGAKNTENWPPSGPIQNR